MKNFLKLAELMNNDESGCYNQDFKEKFKKEGKKAMREVAEALELKEYDISFNPGGIAVSGDLRLMGMWSEGNGIYISMNKDFPGASWGQILYRRIKHMKDFTGGTNNWYKFSDMFDLQKFISTMLRLKD